MTENPCPLCGRPIPDVAYVCPACTDRLAGKLREAAALWPILDAAVSRLVSVSGGSGTSKGLRVLQGPRCGPCDHQSCEAVWKSQTRARNEPALPNEGALPLNTLALEHAYIITNTVTEIARKISEERGIDLPTEPRRRVVFGAVTVTQPRDDVRPSRCIFSDLPTDQCACGRPHNQEAS